MATNVGAKIKTSLVEVCVGLSGLRQLKAIEGPLKMIKNAVYFTSKALSVLKIFKFLFSLFGDVVKPLD